MFIVCDMIAVALLVLVGMRLDGTREKRRERVEPGTPDADADRAAATAAGPTIVEGAGADRDPLFPVADPGAGTPRDEPDDADDAPAR
jgi:signal peptidase II